MNEHDCGKVPKNVWIGYVPKYECFMVGKRGEELDQYYSVVYCLYCGEKLVTYDNGRYLCETEVPEGTGGLEMNNNTHTLGLCEKHGAFFNECEKCAMQREIAELKAENEKLHSLLKLARDLIEDYDDYYDYVCCPSCGRYTFHDHTSKCKRMKFFKEMEEMK